MKNILCDIVAHTNKLGFLNVVKITGTEDSTLIESMAPDRSVVLFGKTTTPYPELIGVFGMPQLEKLRYLLDGSEYEDDATIELTTGDRNSKTVPTGLHFENKDGDFKNDYRFMNQDIINEVLKPVSFNGVKWVLTVSPTLSAIQRFQFQAGANTEYSTFVAKTDGDKLKFKFGDAASHAGEFVFASGISNKLTRVPDWPIAPILSILRLADTNNTTMSFSDQGAVQIKLDSGLAVYEYIVPAHV